MGKKGYIKLRRTEQTNLLLQHPNEFLLLTLVALRAKRTQHFDNQELEVGEALVGYPDVYESIKLTEQNYRTAKKNLEQWKFVTTKPTNRGTIIKLDVNNPIFDVNPDTTNEQTNRQPTNSQRTGNEQPTTNKNDKNDKNVSMSAKQKQTNPDIKTFIGWWYEAFNKKFNAKYHVSGEKEGALVKKLLSTYSYDELVKLGQRFFKSEDSFIQESTYGIGVFHAVVNKLSAKKGEDDEW